MFDIEVEVNEEWLIKKIELVLTAKNREDLQKSALLFYKNIIEIFILKLKTSVYNAFSWKIEELIIFDIGLFFLYEYIKPDSLKEKEHILISVNNLFIFDHEIQRVKEAYLTLHAPNLIEYTTTPFVEKLLLTDCFKILEYINKKYNDRMVNHELYELIKIKDFIVDNNIAFISIKNSYINFNSKIFDPKIFKPDITCPLCGEIVKLLN